MDRRVSVLAVLGVDAVALAALAAWAAAGWPGAPNPCLDWNTCFCEAFRDGWIRQPSNTLSNLGFVAAGLALAARARSPRALLFSALISLLGPGSMALHASMTHWGGVVDVITMFLFIAFPIAHNAERLIPGSRLRFAALYGALAASLACLEVVQYRNANLGFGLLIVAFLGSEAAVRLRGAARERDPRWLAGSVLCFFLGFALWLPSRRSDGALCAPGSWLQGHAAWHLLCALAAAAIFRYLEPELSDAPTGHPKSCSDRSWALRPSQT